MTRKEKMNLWAFYIFLVNACVLVPIGYIFTDHVKGNRAFSDNVVARFIETDRKTSEVKRISLEAGVTVDGHTRELDEIKQRINRLEAIVYEISSRSARRSTVHDKK